MKHCRLVFLSFLLLQTQWPFLHVDAEDGFVKANGIHFLLNGSPYYANGFNAYWLMSAASVQSERRKVSSAFKEARSHGLIVARTWAFSDGGYSPLQYYPGTYNEQMFQGLDFVLSEARTYGIKLILSLVNNYENFGGKKQYVNWARSLGQNLASDDEFFSNSVVKDIYKKHITTVLTRNNTKTGVTYKNDPTIMAWELMNEPRCSSDSSGNTMQAWIEEMASFVKTIDRNHLLEVGLEGFYGQSTPHKQQLNPNPQVQYGTDFIANNQISGVDFATVHSYPDQWLQDSGDETQLSFLTKWVKGHIEDSEQIVKKPILFTEFGLSSRVRNYSPQKRQQLYGEVYAAVDASAGSGGAAAGCMFWQLLPEGMDNLRDGYEIILSAKSSTANLIFRQSQKLNRIRKMYARLSNIGKPKRAKKGGGH